MGLASRVCAYFVSHWLWWGLTGRSPDLTHDSSWLRTLQLYAMSNYTGSKPANSSILCICTAKARSGHRALEDQQSILVRIRGC